SGATNCGAGGIFDVLRERLGRRYGSENKSNMLLVVLRARCEGVDDVATTIFGTAGSGSVGSRAGGGGVDVDGRCGNLEFPVLQRSVLKVGVTEQEMQASGRFASGGCLEQVAKKVWR